MLTLNQMIEEAIRIAYEAHKGQTDLDGKAVILHPMTVASMGYTPEEIVCGWLHDVVEDTDWTFERLQEAGFGHEVIEALRLLTHSKEMPYMDYVQNIINSRNLLALTTKYHDLQHNLQRGIFGGHTKQVEKHSAVLPLVREALLQVRKN